MIYDNITNKVIMDVTVGVNKYFAIGFSNRMKNADMLIFQGTGSGKVLDA